MATSPNPGRTSAELAARLTLVVDNTFGALRLTESDDSEQLVGVSLLPDAEALLIECEEASRPVRVLVPDGEAALDKQAFLSLRDHLGVEQVAPMPAIGRLEPPAATGEPFVCADAVHREVAASLGYAPMPHPTMARGNHTPGTWLLAAILGPRELFERIDVLPFDLERRPDGTWRLLAALQDSAVRAADAMGLVVRRLDFDIAIDSAFLVSLDAGEWDSRNPDRPLLWRDGDRALIALRGRETPDELPHGSHGHVVALVPDPGILRPPPPSADIQSSVVASTLSRSGTPVSFDVVERTALLDAAGLLPACPAIPSTLQADIDRFSGVAALDAAGTITSRHTAHPDNARVVDALVTELRAIGYCAWREAFTWSGQTRHNVVADLSGTGLLRIRPDVLEILRAILIRWPWPDPPDPWLKEVRRSIGDGVLDTTFEDASPWVLRQSMEYRLGLRDWWPWWRRCVTPGWGAELVIVGCHLDSTAGFDPSYNPATGPARGADDDGSGMAGVLALARWLWSLRGQLRHTVRFCFFNGEEQGLVGSKAYAAALKAQHAPIRAVVCMDMIGYNSDANRIFEVHAGYSDPAVRDASLPIANSIASWAAALGALAPAQVYRGTSSAGTPDRSTSDGAINRSDHSAFHQQGYPAVLVSEDFFGNLPSEPLADPNPNYHRNADAIIDADYAADIVCAVGHAVRSLAS